MLSCVLVAGHHPPNLHRDTSGEDWISGEAFADFDAFCAEHGVGTVEAPAVFAAWLGGESGWDGDMQKVSLGDNGVDGTDDERDR